MQHVLENGKRALSVAVAAATIMFSVGASLLTPSQAKAASAGDLIKGTSLTTVYYYGHDGSRYVFPNEKTYMTWYSDFSGVTTISDSALADIELGGNVVYRPGSQWIKVTSNPDVYAVGVDGTIHLIEEEAVASDLAGSDWASRVHDVPDVFFPDYSVGLPLSEASVFDGALYMDGGSYYLAWDGEMREISSAGLSANNLESSFFLDGDDIDDSSLSAGADVTGEWNVLVDAAQTVEADDDEVAAEGDLMISEASSNPASASVADLAVGVEMLSFDVEADEDATLSSVTFSMTGLADATDVGSVYLYEGVTRLTDARSVNSSTRQVTFGSLGLDVDAGDTRTFTLRADIASAATASDVIGFEIASADDVEASGDVGGSFPVEGGEFTVATVSVGTATVTEYGTITNPTIGEDDAVVGQFKITAASEDASVEAVTLKFDDSDDHSDFWLWVDGEAVAEGSDIGDNLVEFDLSASPVDIEDGSNEIFSVSADIGGENGDDVKVYLDNSADLIVTGGDYGFGMAITRTAYDGDNCTTTACDGSWSEVEGGDVTLVFNGPTAQDIRLDSQDQTLLEFSLTSAQTVTVKDLDVFIMADDATVSVANDATDALSSGAGNAAADDDTSDNDGLLQGTGTANVTDIKIVNADTGEVLMGPLELDTTTDDAGTTTTDFADAVQTIDFSDDFEMVAGETLNLAITADIDDGVTSGTEFAAGIDISGFLPYDGNDDLVTNIIPSGDITGYNMEATSASVTFAIASAPVSSTVVQGKQGTEVLGVSVTAADASDVTISNLTFTGYADDTEAGTSMTAGGETDAQLEDLVSSCSLYDADDMLLDGPVAPVASTGKLVFDGMDWTVMAGQVELLSLVCNLSNPSQTDVDPIAFDLLADSTTVTTSTEVTAVDEEGDDATVVISKPGAANTLGINDSTADATQNATVMTSVDDAGSITVAASSGTPSADFVLTGSSSNYVGEFTVTATLEDAVVDKLVVTEESAGDMGQSASAHANNVSMVTITYPSTDGTTASASAVMTSNKATFSGLTLDAMVGVQNNVKVYVNVPSSDRNSGGSAQSNEAIEVGLSATAGDFNAVGADSGTTVTSISAVETDRRFIVRETKPTVSLSSSSPSGSKTPGNQEVIRFNVAAGSNEDVAFSEIVFQVAASDNNGETTSDVTPDWNECDSNVTTGIDSTDFDFYNLSEDGTSSPLTSTYSFMTSALVACTTTETGDVGFVSMVLTTAEIVPAGQTYVYSLWFDSSAASAVNDDTIQFSLPVDPIVSTFLASSTVNAGTQTATTTTITVADSSGYSAGDVVCINLDTNGCDAADERAYVASVPSGTTLMVVRGYLGTAPAAFATSDRVERMPSSFHWTDDGSIAVSATDGYEEVWGSYLVDSLSVTGGTLAF